jgi:hypothetical protein
MMMNLLEIEDAVKGMSDQQLLQEAMNPSGNIPQFLIVSEKQNRDKVRKEYAQNKPQEGTVAQRIMAGDSGIMGAMPQQMAMAPQMPQRMPQMPPQGIQQAMPPQRMFGGGVVRMQGGGRAKGKNIIIQEILASNPNPTMADFLAAGLTQEDIQNYSYLINPSALDRARSGVPFGRPASEMYQGAGFDMNMQMFDPAKMPPGEGSRNVYAGADGFMGLGSLFGGESGDRAPSVSEADAAAFRLAEDQLDRMAETEYMRSLITDEERAMNTADAKSQRLGESLRQGILSATTNPYMPSAIAKQVSRDLPLTLSASEKALTKADLDERVRSQRPFREDFAEFFGDKYDALKLGAQTAGDYLAEKGQLAYDLLRPAVADAYSDISGGLSGLMSGPKPRANVNNFVDDQIAGLSFMDDEFAGMDFFDQSQYGGKYGEGLPSKVAEITTPNDASGGGKKPDGSAERVDTGNLPLIGGADAASGRLAELQAMIDKQSTASSDAARGAALVALGTGIMEGKTAQGGREAANILAKDAQAQGSLKLEGAKMRLQDARSAERLQIMRDDLLARVGISQNQNNRTALIEINKSIEDLEKDPMLALQIQKAIREGKEPDSPKYRRLMQLREASVFLTQLVAPETKQFFSKAESGGSSAQTPASQGPVAFAELAVR